MQHFLVRKMLEGAKKLSHTTDSRLPITAVILHRLVDTLTLTQTVHFNAVLIQAMFLVAFHGFLRIGEITVRSNNSSSTSNIQARDCSINFAHGKIASINILIRHTKHSHGQVFNVIIPANGSKYCPAQALHTYLKLAKPTIGPLFQFMGGIPVTRSYFDQQLRHTLQAAGFDPSRYKGHSFRIGAATEAVSSLGLSEHQVQKLGRWKSNAFRSYVRIPQMGSFS